MMHGSSDAQPRTVFTMEQKRQAYDNRMNSINKNRQSQILPINYSVISL